MRLCVGCLNWFHGRGDLCEFCAEDEISAPRAYQRARKAAKQPRKIPAAGMNRSPMRGKRPHVVWA